MTTVSRRMQIANMLDGDELVFLVPAGQGSKLMQSNMSSISRLCPTGSRSQSLWIAINPTTREVRDVVIVKAIGGKS